MLCDNLVTLVVMGCYPQFFILFHQFFGLVYALVCIFKPAYFHICFHYVLEGQHSGCVSCCFAVEQLFGVINHLSWLIKQEMKIAEEQEDVLAIGLFLGFHFDDDGLGFFLPEDR